jgi:hypothetical protein
MKTIEQVIQYCDRELENEDNTVDAKEGIRLVLAFIKEGHQVICQHDGCRVPIDECHHKKIHSFGTECCGGVCPRVNEFTYCG